MGNKNIEYFSEMPHPVRTQDSTSFPNTYTKSRAKPIALNLIINNNDIENNNSINLGGGVLTEDIQLPLQSFTAPLQSAFILQYDYFTVLTSSIFAVEFTSLKSKYIL